MKRSEYMAYFRNIASTHTDLLHGTDGMKAFFSGHLSEAWKAIQQNEVKKDGMVLFLEFPERGTSDQKSDNFQKVWLGAFHLSKPSSGNAQDYDQDDLIIDECEAVAYDIINRMIYDRDRLRIPHYDVIRHFDPSSVNVQDLYKQNYNNRAGVRVEFSLGTRWPDFVESKFSDLP